MMNRGAVILALCWTAALAESNFNAPLAGIARDARQQLRFVHGVSGNFILRQAIASGVRNWTFAGFGGLVKTEKELLFLDMHGAVVRRRSIPDEDVVLSAGAMQGPALYYVRAENELWMSGDLGDRQVPIEPAELAGTVLALAPSGRNQAVLAICRANSLWLLTVNLKGGTVAREKASGGAIGETACGAGQAVMLMIGSQLVLATANGIVMQTDRGEERRIPFSAANGAKLQVHQAGEQWVQLEIANEPSIMIRVNGPNDKCYRLPGPGTER